jgi:hypothetical protein
MKKNKTEDTRDSKKFLFRIVVKFQNSLHLAYRGGMGMSDFFSQEFINPLSHLLKRFPCIRINKLFASINPDEIIGLVNRARELDTGYQPPNFLTYYSIDCPAEINAESLLQTVLTEEKVELAYIESDSTPPQSANACNDHSDINQGYLNAAPEGINAKYAWGIAGGTGEGNVMFIDIEQGWNLYDENITISALPNTGVNHVFKDHGAAVLGVIMMQKNEKGGGITPKVKGDIISQWRPDGYLNNADAIMTAIAQLKFGDIILLEAQVRDSPSSKKFWPVEIHEATFQVIRLATALGITVIEAAANGGLYFSMGNDLDRFTLNGKKILNRFSPDFKDSGAIIVAAASSAVPHTRIYNSNYGNRIDCYAWGEKVATPGNFPMSSGKAVNTYAKNFGGTSSASAIITGCTIAVQSVFEANHNFRLTPKQMRNILSNDLYGTSSANGHSRDKIGVMPDLKKIIDNALNGNFQKDTLRTDIVV